MLADSNSADTQNRRRAPATVPRRGRGSTDDAGPSSKKDRDPNWSKSEILALIEAKRQEYVEEMSVDDPRELMCPELGKWGKIALKLNASKGEGDVDRDRDACKYKWSTLLSDFKKIWDFHSRTGRNSEEYFLDISAEDKKLHKLPKAFYGVAYRNMAEWLKCKATINPPHARDTSDPNDANYGAPLPRDEGPGMDFMDTLGDEVRPSGGGSFATHIDPTMSDSPAVSSAHSQRYVYSQNVGAGLERTSPQTASTGDVGGESYTMRSPRRGGEDINLNAPPPVVPTPPRPGVAPHVANAAPTILPPGENSAPAGTIPPVFRQGRSPNIIHVLSSTATSAAAELRKSMGSTGHRKKRSAEATSIADGVTQSAEKMVRVLSDINETQKNTEKEKLQVQTRHFQEQLLYKRERDQLALENVRIAQEHTRLGLLNQQMVIQAIANLASVLSRTITQSAPQQAAADTGGPSTSNAAPPDAAPDAPAAE